VHSAWNGHPQNDLYFVGWNVKLYSLTHPHGLSMDLVMHYWSSFVFGIHRGLVSSWLWANNFPAMSWTDYVYKYASDVLLKSHGVVKSLFFMSRTFETWTWTLSWLGLGTTAFLLEPQTEIKWSQLHHWNIMEVFLSWQLVC